MRSTIRSGAEVRLHTWRWIAALALAVALRPAGVAAAESTAAMQPEQIRMVQRALQERGYQVAPTGAWDPGTSTALADFQSSSGLPATGQWDRAARAV